MSHTQISNQVPVSYATKAIEEAGKRLEALGNKAPPSINDLKAANERKDVDFAKLDLMLFHISDGMKGGDYSNVIANVVASLKSSVRQESKDKIFTESAAIAAGLDQIYHAAKQLETTAAKSEHQQAKA